MAVFPILFQDADLVIIDKPSGFHVHPPETRAEKVPRHKIILHQLRDQVGQKVYPLHRLDVATSGVLAFALSSEAASFWGKKFQAQTVKKTYWAVVRGFLPDEGSIDLPLALDSTNELAESKTLFRSLRRIELPAQIGKKHQSARYSWLEVSPQTGRFHQIRRHMNRVSHPVIGDSSHGDSYHNRFFRETLKISGLCLRAVELELPLSGSSILKDGPPEGTWTQVSVDGVDGESEISNSLKIKAPEHKKWIQLSELFAGNFTTTFNNPSPAVSGDS